MPVFLTFFVWIEFEGILILIFVFSSPINVMNMLFVAIVWRVIFSVCPIFIFFNVLITSWIDNIKFSGFIVILFIFFFFIQLISIWDKWFIFIFIFWEFIIFGVYLFDLVVADTLIFFTIKLDLLIPVIFWVVTFVNIVIS